MQVVSGGAVGAVDRRRAFCSLAQARFNNASPSKGNTTHTRTDHTQTRSQSNARARPPQTTHHALPNTSCGRVTTGTYEATPRRHTLTQIRAFVHHTYTTNTAQHTTTTTIVVGAVERIPPGLHTTAHMRAFMHRTFTANQMPHRKHYDSHHRYSCGCSGTDTSETKCLSSAAAKSSGPTPLR